MRWILRILIVTWLLWTGFHPAAAQEATNQAAVVHAVFFWMEGCPSCEVVMQTVLPELEAQFGEQLDVQLVEVGTTEEVERLYRIGASLGLSKEETGVPMIVIADQVLVGSEQIPVRLQGLVERYLEAGGVDAPDLEALAAGAASVTLVPEVTNDGMVVAWVVLIGMVVAVVIASIALILALSGKKVIQAPAWLDLVLPVLSVLGLGVALYLLYVEATPAQAICGPLGDCNSVQDSPYAMIMGWLPVGMAGAIGYLAILAAWYWGRRSQAGLGALMPVVLFGFAAFGTLYSIYLTYLEIFVIHAVCMWCVSSAILMTLILMITLPKAAAWLTAAEEDEI